MFFNSFKIRCEYQPGRSDAAESVENILVVDISDALSERDKVKFTVHTKVCTVLPDF